MREDTTGTVKLILRLSLILSLCGATLNVEAQRSPRPVDECRATIADQAPVHPDGEYPTYDEILQTMIETADAFPTICRFVDLTETYELPPTVEGRRLAAVKISDRVDEDEDEPSFMFVAAHHGNEIINPVIALDALARLTAGYGVDPVITDAVDEYEIWIAPVWNPDGYEAGTRYNANGRDLNRDYPFGWWIGGCTSGEAPLTQVETETMIVWTLDQRFDKVIDYHSSGRETLHGYRCLDHPFDLYLEFETTLLSLAAGYGGQHRGPSADGEHYQWQLGAMGAHAFLIETGLRQQPSFENALVEAEMVWPSTLWMIERPIPLSGHVTDASTGAPIEASIDLLNIRFENGETNSSGGLHGRYSVFAPRGTYFVEFGAPGYVPQLHEIEINPREERLLDVALEPVGDRIDLVVSPLRAGAPARLRVSAATPARPVYFVLSISGIGSTFVPALNVTLDLDRPRLIGSAIADDQGSAQIIGFTPILAQGRLLYFQAAQYERLSGLVVKYVN